VSHRPDPSRSDVTYLATTGPSPPSRLAIRGLSRPTPICTGRRVSPVLVASSLADLSPQPSTRRYRSRRADKPCPRKPPPALPPPTSPALPSRPVASRIDKSTHALPAPTHPLQPDFPRLAQACHPLPTSHVGPCLLDPGRLPWANLVNPRPADYPYSDYPPHALPCPTLPNPPDYPLPVPSWRPEPTRPTSPAYASPTTPARLPPTCPRSPGPADPAPADCASHPAPSRCHPHPTFLVTSPRVHAPRPAVSPLTAASRTPPSRRAMPTRVLPPPTRRALSRRSPTCPSAPRHPWATRRSLTPPHPAGSRQACPDQGKPTSLARPTPPAPILTTSHACSRQATPSRLATP
jgi:hypothetical protein